MSKEIDDLLEIETKNNWKRWIFWTIFIIITLLAYRIIIVGYDFEIFFKINAKKEEAEFFTNLLLSVIASVLGAVAVTFIYTIKEPKKLKKILLLARKDFILEFLKECEYYSNRYCENYNTIIKLEKHNEYESYFSCRLEYNYKKILRSRRILMRIDRIREHYKQVNEEKEKNDLYIEHEFYWKLDERAISEDFSSRSYVVKNLFINKKHQIKINRFDDEKSGSTSFEGYIPNGISLREPVELSYVVRFPIEAESAIDIVYELPTKGAKLKFDYSSVKDDIDVYSKIFISSRNGPTPIIDDEEVECHEKEFQYDGWLMPKNGCYFVWWRKLKSEATV